MAKKVTGYLKLQVPAGAANPSPPIGPALGQRGLNIMEFCKAFNAQTQKEEKNTPIPAGSTSYGDRSFTLEMKTPATCFLPLRDETPADVLLPQAGRQDPVRFESPGPRQGRRGDQSAGARDRREEDEGSQL